VKTFLWKIAHLELTFLIPSFERFTRKHFYNKYLGQIISGFPVVDNKAFHCNSCDNLKMISFFFELSHVNYFFLNFFSCHRFLKMGFPEARPSKKTKKKRSDDLTFFQRRKKNNDQKKKRGIKWQFPSLSGNLAFNPLLI